MWIINEGSWLALAARPKAQSMMIRSLESDETYNYGMAHCFMGLVYSMPEAQGGKPDEAKKHFEKALEISKGRNLTIHVFYARQYARFIFDRQLHDRLLKKVLEADISTLPKDLTIMNVLAKEHAQRLLDSADIFFKNTSCQATAKSQEQPCSPPVVDVCLNKFNL